MKRVDHSSKGKWDNPFTLGALINLAGTEMHTNYSMLRHFWWASNALWPSDIVNKDISACILVSEKDEIVPSADVAALFDTYNKEQTSDVSAWDEVMKHLASFSIGDDGSSDPFVKAQVLKDASHGDFIFDDEQRLEVIRTISAMHRLNTIKQQRSRKSSELFQTSFTTIEMGSMPDFGELIAQMPFMTTVLRENALSAQPSFHVQRNNHRYS